MKDISKISIGFLATENQLWKIQLELMNKYGTDTAEAEIDPLKWYIGTGRACVDFIRAINASKPFMIARKLHMGGSHEEVINRIKEYLIGIGYYEE